MTTARGTGIALVVACCCGPVSAAAQPISIQGIVADSGTGAPLGYVAITLDTVGQPAYRALTDRNGFYQILGIRPGVYTLRTERVGYRDYAQILTLEAGQRRTVSLRLAPNAVPLEGIVVTAEQGAAITDLQRQVVTPADIRMVPVPGGTGDLAAYLQTLPSVTTTGDRGGQLFVRGGLPSANLVLVDGIPIYQPFHIVGSFSVFPEDLVSSADFYPGGFGARYQGRTSSVLDVRLREGHPHGFRAVASASPFIAEALAEGPVQGATLLASVRRSLIEETSGTLLGATQPVTFESQLFKATTTYRSDDRCSLLALHTADRGRLDPDDHVSRVAWNNLLFGVRCVLLRPDRLVEAHWGYTRSSGDAVAHGSSHLHSSVERLGHDLHVTGRIGVLPIEAGYQLYLEHMQYDVTELIVGLNEGRDDVWGASGYIEPIVRIRGRLEVRPSIALIASPRAAVEPRLRARWEPFGRSNGALQGAVGLYRQYTVGISDMRDVSSVFVAWMAAPDDMPLKAFQSMVGWQQPLGGGLRWSVGGYYNRMTGIPITMWSAVAQFQTQLTRANGETWGADVRVEYASPRVRGFVGYGYSWTLYEATQRDFTTWFGEPVQRYHPPHDRHHQLNAVLSLNLGHFNAAARWQFASGLPFTQPLGFDEGFDFANEPWEVKLSRGDTRILVDKPFAGRLPLVHRLDLSLERTFDVSFGRIEAQVGAINTYDRRNMFYYDLFTGRRLDQLPLAPYLSVTLRGR
jgi:Carboxypeptidase regulatory-like domain/TonB-dependent Receptor Plug Domain